MPVEMWVFWTYHLSRISHRNGHSSNNGSFQHDQGRGLVRFGLPLDHMWFVYILSQDNIPISLTLCSFPTTLREVLHLLQRQASLSDGIICLRGRIASMCYITVIDRFSCRSSYCRHRIRGFVHRSYDCNCASSAYDKASHDHWDAWWRIWLLFYYRAPRETFPSGSP